VAMGRGGEMAEFAGDYLPPTMDDMVTAADVASVRPPPALWGYNVQVTDEAFSRIAQVVTERDVEIAVLRQQLADLRSASGSQPSPTAELRAGWGSGRAPGAARPASAREPGAASTRPASAREPGAASAWGPGAASAAEPGAARPQPDQAPAAGAGEPGGAEDPAGPREQAAAGAAEGPATSRDE